MPKPLALLALETMKKRLSAIRRDDGYNTDAGKCVELGPVSLSGVDEAVELQFASESVVGNTGSGQVDSFEINRLFTATIQKRADAKCPKGELVELILADVKRALFRSDQRYLMVNDSKLGTVTYQSARLLPRPDGNEYEEVEVTGLLAYKEGYGNPYAVR